ncbi:3' terminal RNA ribose 2'-O-methyltransferase Hen1 [Geodermatophilus tzadiensis]|uniref:Small RNA 2'-O-methyltransferase n=1 Tax=Geodermatophilus tzadiensis TaxID=1137988 RepID=A0A2T0TC50_9ACTN|nr:3' terminal RNA ribose 2'-O-methyltransferase Hen1 [Geodermatophilus tzadiensis]PRY43231.1 3' terminal RNA ribose 2'-O-methyltransferase Hen1 [Geodermatophilus tzadiensis]
MLVTLTTTHVPATDLGFLLHKNPARAQQVEVSTGTAHVFYPEADEHRCTAALLLEVDPVGLVRTARAGGDDGALAQYVNDRPYAASSLLAVALGKAFSSARRGVSRERPELVDVALPLEVHVPALSCRGGVEMAQRFFAPLGWRVDARAVPLDETLPDWGVSRYVDLRLGGDLRLADALNHLYVALPVLDDAKHYWVGSDEVEKLVRAGSGWLAGHPERDLITRRYLGHRTALTRRAIERLAEVDDADPETLDDAIAPPLAAAGGPRSPEGEDATDRPVPLAVQRHGAVLAALRSAGAQRVVDLGCGAGALLHALLAEPAFTEVLGVDVSARALEVAARRLRLDRLPERQRARIRLLQSGLTYTDVRLRGYDAAVLMEVVEHLDLDRLPALEHAVFGAAAPATVVVTTPNVEYNVRFEGLPAGTFRHRDHRFEWTRQQFADWVAAAGDRYGYTARLLGVGEEDPDVGTPTQMAVFTRGAATEVAA